MSSLLHIASRVEAAITSYVSVRDFTDTDEWRRRLDKEKENATLEFRRVKKANDGACPALHPTLAALYIVLDRKSDLSKIRRDHPDLRQHKFFKRHAKFPENISDLLPPREDRWWEDLAAQSRPAAQSSPVAQSSPPAESHPASQSRPAALSHPAGQPLASESLKIRLPSVKARVPAQDVQEDVQDVDMEPQADDSDVDQLLEDEFVGGDEVVPPKRRQSRKGGRDAAKITTRSRKRKGSSPPPRKTTKRRAGPSRHNPEAANELEAEDYKFECDRCVKVGVDCQPDPLHPCKRCQYNKQGCSLMPVNKHTGKTDRRNLTEEEIFRFRVEQFNKKQQAPERKKPASRAKTSPSSMLSALAIESGSSHSPPAASDSQTPATASNSPAAPASALPSRSPRVPAAARFPTHTVYVEVPAVVAKHSRVVSQAPSAVATIMPATTAANSTITDTADSSENTAPASAAIPVAAVSITPAVVVSAPAAATTVPAAASTISATAITPISVPSTADQPPSPAAVSSSPALAPSLRRHLEPLEAPPSPSSYLRHSVASNSQLPVPGYLMEHVFSLERGMERMDAWMRRDEEWKKEISQRLHMAGL